MRLFIIVIVLFIAMPFGWAEILLDPSLVCKRTKKIRGKLAEICQRNNSNSNNNSNNESTSTLLKEIINGINLGFKECEFQFNNHRWNCTTLRKSMRKILMKDIKETSFVNAITSAGVTYSIARACSTGKLIECSCDKSHYNHNLKEFKKFNEHLFNNFNETDNIQNSNNKKRRINSRGGNKISRNKKWEKDLLELPDKNWEWGGCGDNYKFGIRTSKIFLDSKYKKRSDIHTLVKLHNNQAGRLAVRDNMRIDCKCHGLSGSCTVKTCWSKMPTFHEIGAQLKQRFHQAVRVISSNDGNSFIPEESSLKKPSKHDLVYVEDSPDFCRSNSKTGSLGTLGRECNTTSTNMDGCENLCCNRGYYQRTIIQEVNCKCVFKWCCEVSCSTCRERKEIGICR